jgi:hypothetical protein
MGAVLAVALWRHDLEGRILLEAAGLLWLAVLWLPATRRPVDVRHVISLIVFAALVVVMRRGLGAVVWSVLVLVSGIGALLRSHAPGTTRRRPLQVMASGLSGTIERGGTYATATLVQEFSAGWQSEISFAMADGSGRFELPQVAPGPVHYLVITHPGTVTQYLEVTLAQNAKPLLVRLRPC